MNVTDAKQELLDVRRHICDLKCEIDTLSELIETSTYDDYGRLIDLETEAVSELLYFESIEQTIVGSLRNVCMP